MKQIVQWCLELGISCVSLYAFSIDNFRRPQDEVDALMELAAAKFEELLHVSCWYDGFDVCQNGMAAAAAAEVRPRLRGCCMWIVIFLCGGSLHWGYMPSA
jgi:undecaprenyl pyrophosphate synthase